MEQLLIAHFYYYLPFGLSFLALYYKVVGAVFDFEWRKVGDIISRFLYTIFFGYTIYNINIFENNWFSLIAIGTLILFGDEIISYMFRRSHERAVLENCIKGVLKELEMLNWGEDRDGKH